MAIDTIIVGVIGLAAISTILLKIYKAITGRPDCSSVGCNGCSGCPASANDSKASSINLDK